MPLWDERGCLSRSFSRVELASYELIVFGHIDCVSRLRSTDIGMPSWVFLPVVKGRKKNMAWGSREGTKDGHGSVTLCLEGKWPRSTLKQIQVDVLPTRDPVNLPDYKDRCSKRDQQKEWGGGGV